MCSKAALLRKQMDYKWIDQRIGNTERESNSSVIVVHGQKALLELWGQRVMPEYYNIAISNDSKNFEVEFFDDDIEKNEFTRRRLDNVLKFVENNRTKLILVCDDPYSTSYIIHFIYNHYPILLKQNSIYHFVFPYVIAYNNEEDEEELSFFSIPQWYNWLNSTKDLHLWCLRDFYSQEVKARAKKYFQNIDQHCIPIQCDSPENIEQFAWLFDESKLNERNEWLTSWRAEKKKRLEMGLTETYIYGEDMEMVTYEDFVNKELILSVNMNLEQSVPAFMDGLTFTQRKIIRACFHQNLAEEQNKVQFNDFVSDLSVCQFDSLTLKDAFLDLAVNSIRRSNNVNLIYTERQLVSNTQNSADTPPDQLVRLTTVARKIFPSVDDASLSEQSNCCLPIIPMILVNGCRTNTKFWNTRIPSFCPREIVANLKRQLDGEDPIPMIPKFKNFKGVIQNNGADSFEIWGKISVLSEKKVQITELPIDVSLEKYLDQLSGRPEFLHVNDCTSNNKVSIVITLKPETILEAQTIGLHKFFNLVSTINCDSFTLLDEDCVLKSFQSVAHILQEFFNARLNWYEKRKIYLTSILTAEILKLENQIRFIDSDMKIRNVAKKELIQMLFDAEIDPDPVKAVNRRSSLQENSEEKYNEEDFNYILDMPLSQMTIESRAQILKEMKNKEREKQILRLKSVKEIWIEDLDVFLLALDKQTEDEMKFSKKPNYCRKSNIGDMDLFNLGKGRRSRHRNRKPLDMEDLLQEPPSKKKYSK